jgi:hypothetical protein
MKTKINGKKWRTRDTRIQGLCTPGERLIDIDPRLRPRKRCEIILHEVLHALDQDVDEAVVRQWAKDLARALWRDGYRRRVRKHG